MASALLSHPMVTQERWETFTDIEHATWSCLFERQSHVLQHRASIEVLQGMEKLALCKEKIPKCSDLNAILKQETGFSIVPVKGFLPEALFFEFLSQRMFPSTCFIRPPEQLDYLEEPDLFHDIFGHVPLLINPVFADFMEAFGKKGVEANQRGMLTFAATLYWYTVEFGLINTPQGLRIYGAGITSSKGESLYSLASEIPVRLYFNTPRVLTTRYDTNTFQKTYFVIHGFQQLFDELKQLNWDHLHEQCQWFPDVEPGIILHQGEIFRES